RGAADVGVRAAGHLDLSDRVRAFLLHVAGERVAALEDDVTGLVVADAGVAERTAERAARDLAVGAARVIDEALTAGRRGLAFLLAAGVAALAGLGRALELVLARTGELARAVVGAVASLERRFARRGDAVGVLVDVVLRAVAEAARHALHHRAGRRVEHPA